MTDDTAPTEAQLRREREAAERRQSILDAAQAVFFERGLYRATVDEIAARAEIAKGTVYLYYRSKETLLAGVLVDGLHQLNEELAAAYAEHEALGAETRIRRLAGAYLQFFLREPTYLELMMASDRGNFQDAAEPDAYADLLQQSLQGLRWLVRGFEQGLSDGAFKPGDARSHAAMLWSAVNGVLVLYAHPLRREMLSDDITTLYGGVLDVVLAGLRAPR